MSRHNTCKIGNLFKGFSIFGSKEKVKQGLTIYRLPLITRGKGKKPRIALNYFSYFVSTMIFTLWCIFFHKKYNTIFVHHTSPPLLFIPALLYKKIKKSKAILWDLDMWPHTLEAMEIIKNKWSINLLEIIFRQFYKTFDKVLIGSKSFKNIASKRMPEHKIEYFPNWADDLFERLNLKINPPKPEDKIIITYAGNIGEAQGLEVLVNSGDNSLGYLATLPKDPWGTPYVIEFKPSGGLQIRSAGPDGVFDPAGKGDDNFSEIFK
jgi:glycosyltransferase involved in cell wall biosynthesis